MRIKRTHLHWIILAAAALIGTAFGYVQDDIFNLFGIADELYLIGGIGWFAFVIWQVLGLQFPSLQWRGVLPHGVALALIAVFWGFSVVGEVAYFVINGTGSITLFEVIFGAMFVSASHSFALLMLPMILTRVSLMLSRKPDA